MTISIPVYEILDDIYASSALRSFRDKTSVLNPDQSTALRRFIIAAAADIAAYLARRLMSFTLPDKDCDDGSAGCIVFEIDDSSLAATEALRLHLSAAVSYASLALIALNENDTRRYQAYDRCARETVDIIDRCITAPPSSLPTLSTRRPTIRLSYL